MVGIMGKEMEWGGYKGSGGGGVGITKVGGDIESGGTDITKEGGDIEGEKVGGNGPKGQRSVTEIKIIFN